MKITKNFNEFLEESNNCNCGDNCTCVNCTCTTNEANADGTISDDEDDDLENLLAGVEFSTNELIDYIEKESQEVGGQFRAPGYKAQAIKLMKETFKRRKFKI